MGVPGCYKFLAQSNVFRAYGRVSRGLFPRVRRYGLLYLQPVEYDQWWGWWFETPSCPLWRHHNGTAICASKVTRSLDAWKNESLCEELCVGACDMQCAARIVFRADSRFAPRQWETALLCNDVSHWLGASLKSALMFILRYWLYSCTA